MGKKILCITGIVVGIVVIIVGINLLTIGSSLVGEYIRFGGDFFTEMYNLTRDVGYAINRAADNICAALGWILIALGATMGLMFGYKLIGCAEEQKPKNANDGFSQEPMSTTASQEVRTTTSVKEPGYWTCICGNVNKDYVGTCGCGCTREAAKAEEEDAKRKIVAEAGPTENGWRCFCGAENPNYVGTCACGVSKRDVLNR